MQKTPSRIYFYRNLRNIYMGFRVPFRHAWYNYTCIMMNDEGEDYEIENPIDYSFYYGNYHSGVIKCYDPV